MVPEQKKTMENLIELKNVTKIYLLGKVEVRALNGINLSIKKGEYLSIIGPSGSGKSTLMNLIGCLDVPTSGEYRFNGKNVSGMTEDELAKVRNREIGFVFQSFNLLSRSNAVKNVELPLLYRGLKRHQRRDGALSALESVRLLNRELHRPVELSGGEAQRVAIARAIVNDPSIILADEPTGNLDTKTGREILRFFEELNTQGRTVLIVTHDPSIAERTHRVISILDGSIIKDTRKN